MDPNNIIINIIYQDNKKLPMKLNKLIKIKEILSYYLLSIKNKSLEDAANDSMEYILIYKGSKLDLEKTAEFYHLQNKHCIQILTRSKDFQLTVKSAIEPKEPDIELIEYDLPVNLPFHLRLLTGLNAEGICQNPNCTFKSKTVRFNIQSKHFDFIKNLEKIRCPICNFLILAQEFYFYNNNFILKGKVYSKESGQIISRSKSANNTNKPNKFYKFATVPEGMWMDLVYESHS